MSKHPSRPGDPDLFRGEFMGTRKETWRSNVGIHIHHGKVDLHHWGRQFHKFPGVVQREYPVGNGVKYIEIQPA